jgi:two-component system, OmpR family, phosphate regulon sensor histidine kinase PhoR
VSKRLALILGLGAVLTAILLLLPSLTARSSGAFLVAILAGAALRSAFKSKGDPQDGFPQVSQVDRAGHLNDAGTNDIVSLGKLFEATMSGMREGVLIIDREMRVVASNLAARDVFTYATDAPDGRRLTELTRNPVIYSVFLEALNGKKRTGVKVEAYGPERRVFDLGVAPLSSGGGDARQGAIGVFFDITQIERLEHVRQEFLSNVSHELRTPLTAILAFVETLEDGAVDDGEHNRRFLSIIRRNAERMQTLIDDILELSAIEAGNIAVESGPTPLYPIVADAFMNLASKAETRSVTLLNEVSRDATVFADGRRLEQMLTNLIDNAIKFNRDQGTVSITHKQNGHDEIHVSDTGEGIPAEHLGRLFERFYRVDRARSREMGGTGLGLAIVKHLARAHGGEVTVTSKAGEGSTFVIKLPKAKQGFD